MSETHPDLPVPPRARSRVQDPWYSVHGPCERSSCCHRVRAHRPRGATLLRSGRAYRPRWRTPAPKSRPSRRRCRARRCRPTCSPYAPSTRGRKFDRQNCRRVRRWGCGGCSPGPRNAIPVVGRGCAAAFWPSAGASTGPAMPSCDPCSPRHCFLTPPGLGPDAGPTTRTDCAPRQGRARSYLAEQWFVVRRGGCRI